MNSRNPAVITRHASDSGVRFDEPEARGLRNSLFRSGPVKSHVVPRSVSMPDDGMNYRCTNAAPVAATQDYHTPHPVIANFDGDPWS